MDPQDGSVVLQSLRRFVSNEREESWSYWAEDCVVFPPAIWPESSPVHGLERAREFFDGLDDAWGHDWPTRLKVQTVRATPVGMVVEFEFRPSGLESGIPLDAPLSAHYVVRDGKIAEAAFFMDEEGHPAGAGIP